jgi:RNA polymerase sigma-70 factor (ECF subfamily)
MTGAENPTAPVSLVAVTRDFATFYTGSRDPVAKALTVLLGNQDLAVEAVDEAMARAYQRWSRVGALDNPAGWVYRVALNWSLSALRQHRRPPPPGPLRTMPAPEAGEPDVIRALAELDVRQRAVVVCRYLLGWSEAETATALRAPIGTVKSRLHRATRQLSHRLSHLRNEEA